MSAPTLGVVLAAGGGGTRMGGGKKQFAALGGVPILVRALAPFLDLPHLLRAVVVVPPEDLTRGGELLRSSSPGAPVTVVPGGATRQASVGAGLAALPEADAVLVHDAARPLVSADLVARVADAASRGEAVVPVLPLSDSLKRLEREGLAAVSRDGLYAAQTPQGFPLALLREAHAEAAVRGLEATDDASLIELLGRPVRAVPGEPTNLKITTPADLELAEALVASRETERAARRARTGIGYDAHRLEEGRPCVLGGVRIQSPRGPAGHSDGDVLAHAITDALLGAAGEPDIGQRFPPDDPRWAGADSLELLARVGEAVKPLVEILYVDSFLIAEAPRIGPHVPAMRAALAKALGLSPERVNVKATTAEGLGALGRGEGIAAQAIVTVLGRGPGPP